MKTQPSPEGCKNSALSRGVRKLCPLPRGAKVLPSPEGCESSALSPGERVSRSGAFISRSATGEGSFGQQFRGAERSTRTGACKEPEPTRNGLRMRDPKELLP